MPMADPAAAAASRTRRAHRPVVRPSKASAAAAMMKRSAWSQAAKAARRRPGTPPPTRPRLRPCAPAREWPAPEERHHREQTGATDHHQDEAAAMGKKVNVTVISLVLRHVLQSAGQELRHALDRPATGEPGDENRGVMRGKKPTAGSLIWVAGLQQPDHQPTASRAPTNGPPTVASIAKPSRIKPEGRSSDIRSSESARRPPDASHPREEHPQLERSATMVAAPSSCRGT